MPLFAVLLISLFLVGCASAPPVSVSGADDPFEDVVQVSTYGYYQIPLCQSSWNLMRC